MSKECAETAGYTLIYTKHTCPTCAMASGTRRHYIVAGQLDYLENAGLAALVCLGSKLLMVPAIRVRAG